MKEELYEKWLKSKELLDAAKKTELMLRTKICSAQLDDKMEGSRTVTSGQFKVTATAKLTRSIDKEVLEAIFDDMSPTEQECIKFSPSLILANYKLIEQSGENSMLMDAITVKPATPTLSIKILEGSNGNN